MIVTVTGGRSYSNRKKVFAVLDAFHMYHGVTELRHGAAPGADSIAARWAVLRGVDAVDFSADWDKHGKMAGPIRNRWMLDASPRCDLLIAFPGGRGTAGCVYEARKRGIPVMECV